MARFGSLICLRLWLQAEKPLSGDCHPGTIRLTNRLFVVDINYTWYCYRFDQDTVHRYLGLKLHGQTWQFRYDAYDCYLYENGIRAYRHNNIIAGQESILRHITFSESTLRVSPLGIKPLDLAIRYTDPQLVINFSYNQIDYYCIIASTSELEQGIRITHKRHFKTTKSVRMITTDMYNACISLVYELQQ